MNEYISQTVKEIKKEVLSKLANSGLQTPFYCSVMIRPDDQNLKDKVDFIVYVLIFRPTQCMYWVASNSVTQVKASHNSLPKALDLLLAECKNSNLRLGGKYFL